ncbi:MAG: Uma2 family endonuclease [Defluviitaleaceae bacterium]|nr:Uma2 family endonuclease [Defluviitaleaceae bacterium]
MSNVFAFAPDYQEPPQYEVLGNKIVYMAPFPSPNHNRAVINIASIFRAYLRGKTSEVFASGIDVFMEDDTVIPDIMIVCDRDKIRDDGIHGAPDLIVEVISPTTISHDKLYKMGLYERCGVREYWLVDTNSLSLDIYVLKDRKLILNSTYGIVPYFLVNKMTDEERASVLYFFSSPTFPNMEINLSELFDNIVAK